MTYANQLPYFLDRSFIAKFKAKLDLESVPGCHIWTASKVDGYGQVRTIRPLKMRKAHSVALEIHLGRRLGPGKGTHSDRLQANHRDDLCNRKDCANPAHLYEGTQRQNMLDARKKHPKTYAPKTHCPRGHEYDAIGYNGSRYCKRCQRASNDRTVQRRIAGLVDSSKGRKRKPACIHSHAFDYTDNRGSVLCRTCQNQRRRDRADAIRKAGSVGEIGHT